MLNLISLMACVHFIWRLLTFRWTWSYNDNLFYIINEAKLSRLSNCQQHLNISPGCPNLLCWTTSPGSLSAIAHLNTLRPRQNGRHFPDDIFKCIFLNENAWISLKISLKFVPKVRINKIPVLVQIMAWRRPGDKLLSEQMMDNLLTHICVARPQWVTNTVVYWRWRSRCSEIPNITRI